MSEHVLVIGGMLVDTKCVPVSGLEPGVSNSAEIRNARGGTARNVAENLGRLGASIVLISAVGADIEGRRLLAQTAMADVDVTHVLTIPEATTGSYIAILEDDGTLAVALNDTRVMEHVTPDYLMRQRHLFQQATMIFFDGSLSEHAIQTIVFLAEQYDVPICADPSSTRLVHKIRPYLSHLALVVPNEHEAASLGEVTFVGNDPDTDLEIAQLLESKGVDVVVVTISDYGLVYASAHEQGHLPAQYSEIVDATGTGDAIASAIIFGMLEQLPLVECMRLGAAAAGLTLQSAETVVPDLTLDLLYEHLTY